MIELGQLERRQEDFARRNTRVIVISVEGPDPRTKTQADFRRRFRERSDELIHPVLATKTQADFPHLLVLADEGRGLTDAAGLIHPHVAPDGGDADMPTTILVDRKGMVRWVYRSPEVIARLSPDDVLQAIDQNMP